MAGIRRLLEEADRTYWRQCAEAVQRTQSGQGALDVRYPAIPGLAGALEAAGADGWRDSEAGIRERILTDGARWIRGAMRSPSAKGFDDGIDRLRRSEAPRAYPTVRHDVTAAAIAGRGRDAESQATSPRKAPKVTLPRPAIAQSFAAGGDVADEAAHILAPHTVVPEEAVARYANKRIPPLAETIDQKRRELCRDIVAQAARETAGIRQIMEALTRDGFGRSDWHRETIARTESGQLYNHGRMARYRECGGVTGYRYETIMDGRETMLCHSLNGRMFSFDDASGATPPMHYACRSTISPLMWWETPGEDEWDDPSSIINSLPKGERPILDFGRVDMSDMPAPQPFEEFLRPLLDSEQAEIRAVHQQIMGEWTYEEALRM